MPVGPGDCQYPNEVGPDGSCYEPCPEGYESISSTECAAKCPGGFLTNELSCIRPVTSREAKPLVQCPDGAIRIFDTCYLACPSSVLDGSKNFGLCVPRCPPGFTESPDKQSCMAEFAKRRSVLREACYPGETRLGNRCLGPCEIGMVPFGSDPELCYMSLPDAYKPYFWSSGTTNAKIIFPKSTAGASCPEKFDNVNGSCFGQCPVNSEALGTTCVALCPRGFVISPNKTACERPVVQRSVTARAGPYNGIMAALKWPLLILGLVMVLAFVRGQLGRRR